MSDLSDLHEAPLALMPLPEQPCSGLAPEPATLREPFAWPTPALASYPAPVCAIEPERCEIEGLNGRILPGRLLHFSPDDGVVLLKTPGTRTPMTLRFGQFQRLTLLSPLSPLASALGASDADGDGDPLLERAAVPFRVHRREGEPMEGLSASPRQEPYGLFLFEPVDALGRLRRHFIPQEACLAVELGERIGELLVQQQATTRDAVEAAALEQAALRAKKLGDMLVERQIVSPDQLVKAIEQQSRMPLVRIGEALVALGFITQTALDDALQQQRGDRSLPLGELLVSKGLVSREHLQLALSRKMGYPVVDVRQFPVEPEALAKVPYHIAQRQGALPLLLRGSRLVLALDDPSRRQAIDEIEFISQCSVVPVLARVLELPGAIDRVYDRLGLSAWDPVGSLTMDRVPDAEQRDANELLATLEMEQHGGAGQRREAEEPAIEQSDNSLVKLINQMILEAQAQRVSDIHVECQPGREKVRIRFRKDGQLRPYLELPHTYRAAVIARLKIMCDLDISERRKPQDGKIAFGKFHTGSKLELRLATIPTHGGLEDAVLRLLTSAKPLPLDKLNLAPANLAGLMDAMQRPYGMLLCVGPTGSGKTTTLHSAMGHINTPERKIWTAEDPIEITQPGLRQVQVNAKIDWTFAKALRAFLRADPDVVMVGEIRDAETAQVAVEASLTGHLVLSTLHTNSAAETVTRLLDMGMDPFNFADSLLGVLAQRLVRRLCTQCRVARDASDEEVEEWLGDHLHAFVDEAQRPSREDVLADWRARHAHNGRLKFHHSPGCDSCDGTGFSGRLAIHELLRVSRPVRQLIQTGARAEQILRTAMAEGLRTLRQDGIEKVLAGLTSIEEVRASSNV